jgi:hypothetical protein
MDMSRLGGKSESSICAILECAVGIMVSKGRTLEPIVCGCSRVLLLLLLLRAESSPS